MPRNVDPQNLQIGPGLAGPEAPTLNLEGIVGTPIIGHLAPDNPQSYDPGQAALAAIKAHIRDIHNAHPAVAIETEGQIPPLYESTNLEGITRELGSGILPEPPELGMFARFTTFSGIVDWGILKLGDCSIRLRDTNVAPLGVTNGNAPEDVYPYYLVAPTPTDDPAFPIPGADPSTDIYWNGPSAIPLPPFTPYLGWYTSAGVTDAASNVIRTRVFLGGSFWPPAVISGSVFPADRGVLAILHIPTEGDSAAFLAQPLLKRCIAAILLGQGLEGDACIDPDNPTGGACDGEAGGIFGIGSTAGGDYNPFVFPGRATGQYDLDEICTGWSSIDGTALNNPWNVPQIKQYQSRFAAKGQVRLGSNPDIGPVVDWGIPILGARDHAYAEIIPNILPVATAAPWTGMKYIGDSLVLDSNFFAYRLPCLGDYSQDTGLKYTPQGVDPTLTRETARYFTPKVPYDVPVPGVPYQWMSPTPPLTLDQAGNYDDFDEDYWTWQVARFRHTFLMTGVNAIDAAVPSTEFLGTYWLVHFKTEKDFEQFVLNALPASVYGVVCADPTSSAALVNEEVGPVIWSPFGTAPEYGYSAPTYHNIRREVVLGGTLADHTVDLADFSKATFTWAQGDVFLMSVSGVSYFLPRAANATIALYISNLDVDIQDVWTGSYRTDDSWGTGSPATAPAVLSSPCPAILSVTPFSLGTNSGVPTYVAPAALLSTPDKARTKRIELGFTVLGTHGGSPFAENNGPDAADHLIISMADIFELAGDIQTPAFSTDAALRIFVRRPLRHSEWESSVQPEWTAGAFEAGHGNRVVPSDGRTMLFHSTHFNNSGTGKFGNFVDGGGAPYSFLFTQDKDTGERFLDEVYRYRVTWDGTLTADKETYLVGPGMAGWSSGPLAVPVRPHVGVSAAWKSVTWIWNADYDHTLLGTDPGFNHLVSELQVAGLPDRNPPLQDWVTMPFPSAGILKYPNVDYTSCAPDVAEGAAPQPDYSTATGERGFVRAFDTAFSNAGDLPAVVSAGQPFVTLRIDGLELDDFAYAPGPLLTKPAIFMKVPGLTTWMDLGRADGAGPSKQDPALDGAGCQVMGPYTFDSVDPETGFVYCQVRVNVGPTINLAPGNDAEVPILVKVVMPLFSVGQWDLVQTYTGGGVFSDPSGPGIHCNTIRGLVGIKVVHPTLIETAPVP